jgi:hypothetical protein
LLRKNLTVKLIIDLAGNVSLFGRTVDIGCYESQMGAATIFFLH